MIKRILACFACLIFIFSLIPFNIAYADPFTASQIGAAAYAAMSSWGISFTSGNATAQGLGDYMGTQVQNYVNSKGGTIASVFGSALAVDVAGKLAAGQQMYNSLVDFKDWLVDNYSLSSSDFSLTDGSYNGQYLPTGNIEGSGIRPTTGGVSMYFTDKDSVSGLYKNGYIFNGDVYRTQVSPSYSLYGLSGNYNVKYENGIVVLYYEVVRKNGGGSYYSAYNVATVAHLDNSLTWNGTDYVAPTVIDPSYQWLGQVGDYQDTNLDQLLGDILQDVEGNNLVVVGEVVPLDPPGPTPTPMPIDPDTPLQDVPWEGLDTNLQNLYDQGLEEIGAIGDAQDAITDAVAEQTGALEGAIADNAGVVSGAINQAVSDIQGAISEQTETLSESASATAEATESIAEALEDETINWQKFDLRGLFPFCIPFDIYNMLEALDASPIAPHVQLPFVIESIGVNYTIDLDFSAFDPVAAVMRQMELIVYGIALAWATSKVIKW